ncbi:oxidoreductase [Streptomyces sp. ST1015]|uniref:oxidoreductase n=1 Tax=unclassified Streptomyces TaxID=2593676 RepID=UPI000DD77212|nr:oxidoreductase [Streptomyces sp. ST1015]QZZ29341.1 SDR family NAD(P)-dependent oxidoreductase [Streptomyces sp. ST1015]
MATKRPVALVTGASSGIGEATALAFVEAGFEVIGTSRNTAKVTPRAGVTFLDLDVSSDDSVTELVRQVIDRFGRIDVLVNNAGIGSSGATEESSLAQHRRVLDVNVLGVVRMTKAVLPHMRAQGSGRIVNLSSIYGFMPQPYMAAYIASKHAVEGYSESVDHEVREHGVRVLLVEPGGTSTAFEGNLVQPDTPLPVYERQRRTVDRAVAEAVNGGDAPAVVARAVVTAATTRRPRLRTTAGPFARRLSLLRRVAPARVFDQQIRKFNRLAG